MRQNANNLMKEYDDYVKLIDEADDGQNITIDDIFRLIESLYELKSLRKKIQRNERNRGEGKGSDLQI